MCLDGKIWHLWLVLEWRVGCHMGGVCGDLNILPQNPRRHQETTLENNAALLLFCSYGPRTVFIKATVLYVKTFQTSEQVSLFSWSSQSSTLEGMFIYNIRVCLVFSNRSSFNGSTKSFRNCWEQTTGTIWTLAAKGEAILHVLFLEFN